MSDGINSMHIKLEELELIRQLLILIAIIEYLVRISSLSTSSKSYKGSFKTYESNCS